MPAILGLVTIQNVGGGAILEYGDTLFISPKTAAKSYHGSGSSNTGAQVNTLSIISISNAAQ